MTTAEEMIERAAREKAASPGWLKRDFEAARKEIEEWPEAIRPYLDGTYRATAIKGE